MKRLVLLAPSILALSWLSACTPEARTAADEAPYRSPTGSRTGSPQPPNSLPEGAAVNSPLTSPTGAVATTPVGPAAGSRATPYR